MTWGEFCAWIYGNSMAQYNTQTELLRLIAFQQVTLNPNIKKSDKPLKIEYYLRFPTDPKREPLNLPDPKELMKAWKVKI